MTITYTGDNHTDIADALQRLKPDTVITADPVPGGCHFHQTWPDTEVNGRTVPGQTIHSRWILRVGDSLDTATGAVRNAVGPVDWADAARDGADVEG